MNTSKFKKYSIFYNFHHSKMGFQNSVTVTALNVDQAIDLAKDEVAKTYGTKMLKRFSFKPDPTRCGIAL